MTDILISVSPLLIGWLLDLTLGTPHGCHILSWASEG